MLVLDNPFEAIKIVFLFSIEEKKGINPHSKKPNRFYKTPFVLLAVPLANPSAVLLSSPYFQHILFIFN
jgi:hypothetical protein